MKNSYFNETLFATAASWPKVRIYCSHYEWLCLGYRVLNTPLALYRDYDLDWAWAFQSTRYSLRWSRWDLLFSSTCWATQLAHQIVYPANFILLKIKRWLVIDLWCGGGYWFVYNCSHFTALYYQIMMLNATSPSYPWLDLCTAFWPISPPSLRLLSTRVSLCFLAAFFFA